MFDVVSFQQKTHHNFHLILLLVQFINISNAKHIPLKADFIPDCIKVKVTSAAKPLQHTISKAVKVCCFNRTGSDKSNSKRQFLMKSDNRTI